MIVNPLQTNTNGLGRRTSRAPERGDFSQFLQSGSGNFFAVADDDFLFILDVFFRPHSFQIGFAVFFNFNEEFAFFDSYFIGCLTAA